MNNNEVKPHFAQTTRTEPNICKLCGRAVEFRLTGIARGHKIKVHVDSVITVTER